MQKIERSNNWFEKFDHALRIPPAPLWKRGVIVVLLFIVPGCPEGT
jgi:hypothetical protein